MSDALQIDDSLVSQSDDTPRLQFALTETQSAFVHCTNRYPVLIGPEGEGKTFAAIAGIFAHYQRCQPFLADNQGQPRPMMAAFIRDSHANIKRHSKRSIQRACGDVVEFHDSDHVMTAPGIVCDLFGMDDEKAAGRIQGGEYDIISLEEPAPVLHTGNAGIREVVFDICSRRIRGGQTPKRLQVTMNPASMDHWTYSKFLKFPDPEVRLFRIKKGENPFLSKDDRENRARTFAHRPDLAKRYDEGEFGDVFAGVAITPEFSDLLHVPYDLKSGSPRWLLPYPGIETIRCWDGGLNPTCVILQMTPTGHLNFLDSIVGQNMGMRQMIRTRLKKLLSRPRYERITKWRDIGDPALDTRDQSDSDQRASYVIEEELNTTFEKGVSDWDTRREALKEMFSRIIDGRAMTQINPRVTDGEECNWLISGFSGGYQYPVNATGIVSRDGPLKNKFSHPCDAVSHAMPILLFPAKEPDRRPVSNTKILQRAKGYGVR